MSTKLPSKEVPQKYRTEYTKWRGAAYPYDAAECGCCATQHAFNCIDSTHAEMRKAAKRAGFNVGTQRHIGKTMLKKILAFRKRFAGFYEVRP